MRSRFRRKAVVTGCSWGDRRFRWPTRDLGTLVSPYVRNPGKNGDPVPRSKGIGGPDRLGRGSSCEGLPAAGRQLVKRQIILGDWRPTIHVFEPPK
jgi:hypothetical protein